MQRAEGQESEHVAAGERRDKSLLRVREFWVTEILCCSGAGDSMAITEVELMLAWKFFVSKRGVVPGPCEIDRMLRHGRIVT